MQSDHESDISPGIKLSTFRDPELFFAFVGPIGTNTDSACEALNDALKDWNYDLTQIRLGDLTKNRPTFGEYRDGLPLDEHYDKAIAAGNKARELLKSNDAMAQMGIAEVIVQRRQIWSAKSAHGDATTKIDPVPRRAYLFRSIKLPEEMTTLRLVYGQSFFSISIHTRREARKVGLAEKIKQSHKEPGFDSQDELAEKLIAKDQFESGIGFGQNVRAAFPESDFFTGSDRPEDLRSSISRFVSTIFADPVITPTRAELAMSFARAAALRSADLSRQIGAAITTTDGDLVTVGCNDVPKPGGGQYWEGDSNDARDYHLGHDPNDKFKTVVIADFLARMAQKQWLGQFKESTPKELAEAASSGEKQFIEGSRVDDLLEFGRNMHAEMAAITDAARRGIPLKGMDLYCTTFPCHMCARLIIGSGIGRVFYIEPYPKSATPQLFNRQVAMDPDGEVIDRVILRPFNGVAPRRFFELFAFSKGMRKTKEGKVFRPNKNIAQPRVELLTTTYLENERIIATKLGTALGKLTAKNKE